MAKGKGGGGGGKGVDKKVENSGATGVGGTGTGLPGGKFSEEKPESNSGKKGGKKVVRFEDGWICRAFAAKKR